MTRSLLGHLTACVTGASLDNLFRMAINAALAAIAIAQWGAGPTAESQGARDALLTMLLFNLPFILLAPTAGSLGDRLPKHLLIRGARVADLFCVGLGAWALLHSDRLLLMVAMTAFAVVSALFAPVKLAVMPEIVAARGLARANGLLAGLTVVAILAGTVLAGLQAVFGLTGILSVAVLLAMAGVMGAWAITPLPAQAPRAAVVGPWRLDVPLAALGRDGELWRPALALAGFWSLGALAAVLVPLIAAFQFGFGVLGASGLMLPWRWA